MKSIAGLKVTIQVAAAAFIGIIESVRVNANKATNVLIFDFDKSFFFSFLVFSALHNGIERQYKTSSHRLIEKSYRNQLLTAWITLNGFEKQGKLPLESMVREEVICENT
jgi:hypothetical protein